MRCTICAPAHAVVVNLHDSEAIPLSTNVGLETHVTAGLETGATPIWRYC